MQRSLTAKRRFVGIVSERDRSVKIAERIFGLKGKAVKGYDFGPGGSKSRRRTRRLAMRFCTSVASSFSFLQATVQWAIFQKA